MLIMPCQKCDLESHVCALIRHKTPHVSRDLFEFGNEVETKYKLEGTQKYSFALSMIINHFDATRVLAPPAVCWCDIELLLI
jgi:hypothetical protein